MTRTDIGAAEEIRSLIGWNQTTADWQRLLALEPEGCFVAEEQGRPVGTVTTTTYGTALGWIGMLLVHPQHRQQGIGTALLRHAIHALRHRGVRCIGLDATPAGKLLYNRDGFHAVWELGRWEVMDCAFLPSVDPAITIEAGIAASVWSRLVALDREVFGVARPALLCAMAQQSGFNAVAFDAKRQLLGFGMARSGAHAILLGPVVATTPQAARSLLASLVASSPGCRFFWDIPEPNGAAVRLAAASGFKRQRSLTRMLLGQGCQLPDPSLLYAIADLATG